MADNIKEATQTPPPTQTNTDDNRRRTRSQTRNGGVTTPTAPVVEARGRKRASQSQPGSENKRGRKPGKAVAPAETLSSPSNKETELHSNSAENQDLSKKNSVDTVCNDGKVQDELQNDSAEKDSKKHTGAKDPKKANAERESPQKVCKLKTKPAAEDIEVKDDSGKSEKDQAMVVDNNDDAEATEQSDTKAPVCALPKKIESGVASAVCKTESVSDKLASKSKTEAKDSGVKVLSVETTPSKDATDSQNKTDFETKTTSEQSKIEISNEKPKSDADLEASEKSKSDEKKPQDEPKINDSGDAKLETDGHNDTKKADETKVSETPISATSS